MHGVCVCVCGVVCVCVCRCLCARVCVDGGIGEIEVALI